MKDFKSIVVVAHPLKLVWETIRDRLPELGLLLDDIENITVVDRREEADGSVFLVNIWKANPQIPSMLSSFLNPSMLVWTDRAEWKSRLHECRWRIEPHFLPDGIDCNGVTRYEPAMGDRGTRITFAGELDINGHKLKGVPSFLESTVEKGLESFLTSLIPKNFRKLTQAATTLLNERK
jgi:hypothetical protein